MDPFHYDDVFPQLSTSQIYGNLMENLASLSHVTAVISLYSLSLYIYIFALLESHGNTIMNVFFF